MFIERAKITHWWLDLTISDFVKNWHKYVTMAWQIDLVNDSWFVQLRLSKSKDYGLAGSVAEKKLLECHKWVTEWPIFSLDWQKI